MPANQSAHYHHHYHLSRQRQRQRHRASLIFKNPSLDRFVRLVSAQVTLHFNLKDDKNDQAFLLPINPPTVSSFSPPNRCTSPPINTPNVPMPFSHCINTPRETSANTVSFLKLSPKHPLSLSSVLELKNIQHALPQVKKKRRRRIPNTVFPFIWFRENCLKLRKESNQRSLESYFQQNWSFSKLKIIKKNYLIKNYDTNLFGQFWWIFQKKLPSLKSSLSCISVQIEFVELG